ncbi:MAG: hypothetical protein HRT88_22355 [Lentisphaeraceae bacterium]|nr:hypothetical protein [Lentisphaeraceae bacterium]
MKVLLLVISLVILNTSVFGGDLETLFKNPKILEVKSESLLQMNENFQWQGANKRIAISKKSNFLEHKVGESIAYFSATGKFRRLDAWLYNKVDDGPISKNDIKKKYMSLLGELSKWFGVKAKKTGIDGATRSMAYVFTLGKGREVRLLVGFHKKPYSSEFLNLVIRNYDKSDRMRSSGALKFLKKEKNAYNSDTLT